MTGLDGSQSHWGSPSPGSRLNSLEQSPKPSRKLLPRDCQKVAAARLSDATVPAVALTGFPGRLPPGAHKPAGTPVGGLAGAPSHHTPARRAQGSAGQGGASRRRSDVLDFWSPQYRTARRDRRHASHVHPRTSKSAPTAADRT